MGKKRMVKKNHSARRTTEETPHVVEETSTPAQAAPAIPPPPTQTQAGTPPTSIHINPDSLPDIIRLIRAIGPGVDWGMALLYMETTSQILPLFQTPLPPPTVSPPSTQPPFPQTLVNPPTVSQPSVHPPQPQTPVHTQPSHIPVNPKVPAASSSQAVKLVQPSASAPESSKTPKTMTKPTLPPAKPTPESSKPLKAAKQPLPQLLKEHHNQRSPKHHLPQLNPKPN